MTSLVGVLIDVPSARFDATVAFWAAALSAEPEPVEGMPGGDATYVTLVGATAATDVLIQRTGGPTRIHLDVSVPDRDGTVATAERFGGRRVQHEEGWDVLEDPAGLPLCVGFPDPDALRTSSRRGHHGYLDGVAIDVPAADVPAVLRFWAALLGARPVENDDPTYTPLAGLVSSAGDAFTCEVQAVGVDPDRDGVAVAPRVHVDLSSTDVAAEVTRLTGLGAQVVAEVHDWVTLADPAGLRFCVVPHEGSP